jgi:hypothetical protein
MARAVLVLERQKKLILSATSINEIVDEEDKSDH